MIFLNYQSHLNVILKKFKSCSVVNSDGALLYSRDLGFELLTTTRLVAFQIVKKYLNPKPLDLFVLNDPENGGYQYTKLIFISCLSNNLYIIWDEDYQFIDFKIPPTPLFDQGLKNDFVWQALVNTHPRNKELSHFFNIQKSNIDQIVKLSDLISKLANPKNQVLWLKASQEIFNLQFNSKTHGSMETYYKLPSGQTIKLKLSAEEKQNVRLITIDFTNTNLAAEIHSSSHVVESAIIKKIIDYYQINDFFTQAILDKIKIILPPRSIVSKPHPLGSHNFELQSLCAQLTEYNLVQLNSHTRKSQSAFEFLPYLNFEIRSENLNSHNFISSQLVKLHNFEDFISNKLIEITTMKKNESAHQIAFCVTSDSVSKIIIKNNYSAVSANNQIKLNSVLLPQGVFDLKRHDVVEVSFTN